MPKFNVSLTLTPRIDLALPLHGVAADDAAHAEEVAVAAALDLCTGVTDFDGNAVEIGGDDVEVNVQSTFDGHWFEVDVVVIPKIPLLLEVEAADEDDACEKAHAEAHQRAHDTLHDFDGNPLGWLEFDEIVIDDVSDNVP